MTPELIGELYRRVRRGVRLLDRKIPNWRRIMRKHQSEFNFNNSNYCVLGTLGNHSAKVRKKVRKRVIDDASGAALRFLAQGKAEAGQLGFDSIKRDERERLNLDPNSDHIVQYPALQKIWEAEIDG